MIPNPDQPERCPSIDPDDTLQCGRKIHEDDQCQFGGIGWKKGTPRYVSAEERLRNLSAILTDPETIEAVAKVFSGSAWPHNWEQWADEARAAIAVIGARLGLA